MVKKYDTPVLTGPSGSGGRPRMGGRGRFTGSARRTGKGSSTDWDTLRNDLTLNTRVVRSVVTENNLIMIL